MTANPEALTRNPTSVPERPSVDSLAHTSSFQERHPDLPQLDLLGYFSRHNPEDEEEMASHIKAADIYFIEAPGFEAATQRLMLIAKLPDTEAERNRRQDHPIEKALLGSNKVVASMDLRSSVPEEKELFSEIQRVSKDSNYLVADTYPQVLDQTYERYRNFADLNRRREEGMPARFEDQLVTILEQHPELRDKPDLNIVFTMGSAHSASLARLFEESGIPLKRDFPASPDYIHSYGNELLRTFLNGREPQKELIERAYTEDIINLAWHAIIVPSGSEPDGVSYERFTASKFTEKQMKDLFQLVHDTETLDDGMGS